METKHDVKDIGPVELVLHATLSPVGARDALAAVSVGPDGEAIALWTSPGNAELMNGRVASRVLANFPDPRTGGPVVAYVRSYVPLPGYEVAITDLEVGFPMLQPLPGDRTLIVGDRCRWSADGSEPNAAVFDADGRRVADGILGDGI